MELIDDLRRRLNVGQDVSAVELEQLRFRMLSAVLSSPAPTAAALWELATERAWELTPFFDSIVVQALDAEWRAIKASTSGDGFERIKERCAAYRKRYPDGPAGLLYDGALAMLDGDRAGAYDSFRLATLTWPDRPLSRMYIGAHSIRPYAKCFEWSDGPVLTPASILPSIQWKVAAKKDTSLRVVFGADTRYFLQFARDIIASLKKNNSLAPIHFHVVGWSSECDVESANLRRWYPGEISISWEPYRYTGDKTYFATVRFFRAEEIMNGLGAPIYITDIDNRFTARPEDVAPTLFQYDAGMRMTINGGWFPWWGPSAGNLYLNTTAGGRAVAAMFRRYAGALFTPSNPRTWWFDQLMLNEVKHYIEERHSGISLVNLGDNQFRLATTRPYADVADRKRSRALA